MVAGGGGAAARERQRAAGPRLFPFEGDGEKLRFAFFGTLRDLLQRNLFGLKFA